MTSRRVSIWHKAAALSPLLLLLAYLPGQIMLRCRIDGLLRPVCCCSHPDEDRDVGPVFNAQDCCDHEMVGGDRPIAEATRRPAPDVTSAIASALPVSALSLDLASPHRSPRIWPAQAPPRDGPRLVLLKHAFLI